MSTRTRRRFDDDEPITTPHRPTAQAAPAPADEPEAPDEPAWSTYPDASHGPAPTPTWVITSPAALDTDLGVLKSGKEADVSLVRREYTGASVLIAAKRYRDAHHRLFHRDSGYLEGRRVRRSREMRAMETRTAFGRPIGVNQGVAFPIADLLVMEENSRLLTYRAAWLKDEQEAGRRSVADVKQAAAVAKLYTSEAAVTATRIATQVFGGNGFMEEYPVARFYRDAKILEIGEGTSEVQREACAVDDADHGEGHDHRHHGPRGLREQREAELHEAVRAHLQQHARQDHGTRRRRLDMRVR